MKLFRSLAFVVALLSITGCTHTFVRPAKDTLSLGKSTHADVIKLVGTPGMPEGKVTINGETVQTVTYAYYEGAKFYGLIAPQRTLSYTFFNDVMVGNEFNSSFEEDTTRFDTDKVTAVIKGKSTRSDVIAALGVPSGEVLYPLVKDKNCRGMVYAYSIRRQGWINYNNLVIITLDDKDVVTDVSFKRNGDEQIKS